MATYSKASFNFARYAAARPTYPRQLFEFVFKYHERARDAKWDLAVDLGCGTGQATAELTAFKRVIGVDPSDGMLEKAKSYTASHANEATKFDFQRATVEDLSFLADGSVDLIVAAQSSHWFNWEKAWPEVARVLRKHGSAAFWGYSEFRLTNFPNLTPLITHYVNGMDPTASLGPYWQQPGRSILESHFQKVPRAIDVLPDKFTEWEHVFFAGDHHPHLPNSQPVILRKQMTWDDVTEYLRSFSALHTFLERNPDDRKHPDGDVADRFLKKLKQETGEPALIDVEWPMGVMLVKRA